MGEETQVTTTETAVASSTVPAGLDALRDHLRATHQDAVAELIDGETIESLIGSVETAKGAYKRIAETVGQTAASRGHERPVGGQGGAAAGSGSGATQPPAAPPQVPAGGAANVIDPANLSPAAKIAQGLKARQAG